MKAIAVTIVFLVLCGCARAANEEPTLLFLTPEQVIEIGMKMIQLQEERDEAVKMYEHIRVKTGCV